MRIAFLSDVHGNPTALRACLAHVDRLGAERRVFLGDAVGYLPGELECLALLGASGFLCQQGNHEAMLLHPTERSRRNEPAYRLEDAADRLPEGVRAEIAGWPESRVLDAEGRRILCVHGTPEDPLEGYAYPDTDVSGWSSLPYDAVFTGNTHRPFATREGPVLIANAGSVGLPRDVGRLACFAVYDTGAGSCAHYRVPIDVPTVLAQAGPDLHPATRELFSREAASFVGEVLA